VERILKDPFPVAENYFEHFGDIHLHICQIDRHEPFLHPGVGDLVRRIDPRSLLLEQISNNREEHEENLRRQMDYLRSF
jgi:hypothetical protein